MLGQRASTGDVSQDSNIMPSMIARQQKLKNMNIIEANKFPHKLTSTIKNANNDSNTQDCTDAGTNCNSHSNDHHNKYTVKVDMSKSSDAKTHLFDQDGLVVPKKLTQVYSSSTNPMIKDLNRELKFNKVCGKDVLNQKSELKKVMKNIQESKKRREAEQEMLNRRTPLELRLGQIAERLAKDKT